MRAPAGHAALFKGCPDGGHFSVKIVRHGRASGLVVGQTLVSPTSVTRFIIKHRNRVSRFAVANKLFQRVQAGILAGRALYRMDSADQIKRVDDKQMNSHR
ncbi:Uncharacterised protein [Enterobacter cancerogenus]|uniref:Uncharacterized protein n=1 Tax=Enterobacter cancerogenus TaxID=69218 RepID=A0A484Z999_9ENTR|nr:Uncharacterised protein [Enterobacter cancerogenus]